jgi:hypothetical protein
MAELSRERIWLDTEFIENGTTIQLLSIGMVREDGATYYAEADWTLRSVANDWVKQNVLPQLTGPVVRREQMTNDIVAFCGKRPEFWGYYADYDWVVLCQLFGTMMDLPKGWPMYCRDIKQWCDMLGNPKLPEQDKGEHHALADARWNRAAWEFLALRSAEREGWVSVSERLPPHTGCVLAHYLNKLGKHRTVRAFYAPRFTVEDTSDEGMDDAEVKDDDSTSYIAEGWYEECDQAEYYYRISETVTHWQHLPAAPRTDGETR